MDFTIVIQALFAGGMFAFIEFLIRRKDERVKDEKEYATKADIEPIQEGVLAILQERLETIMTKALDDGELTFATFQTITYLLKAYEGLGGDGYIHALYDQVQELL